MKVSPKQDKHFFINIKKNLKKSRNKSTDLINHFPRNQGFLNLIYWVILSPLMALF